MLEARLRAAARTRNSRSWLQRRIVPSALLLALTYAMAVALTSPLFAIQRVAVSGGDAALQSRVRATVGSLGVNVFVLRTRLVLQHVLAVPDVQAATVSPLLPDGLRVHVVPYVPKVVWRSGGRDYLVTATGFVIKPVGLGGAPRNLIRIDDNRPLLLAHGAHVDRLAIEGAARLQTLLHSRKITIARFVIMPDETLGAQHAAGWQALFSLRGNLAREVDVLVQVIHRGITFHTIDLRPASSPFYR